MKKLTELLLLLSVALSLLSSCSTAPDEPKELRQQSAMIDGTIYYNTNQKIGLRRCGVMDGKITSAIDEYSLPEKNDQSNFGKGYEYQRVDNHHYDIPMEDPEGWIRFCDGLCEDDHSKNITDECTLPEEELCGLPKAETEA